MEYGTKYDAGYWLNELGRYKKDYRDFVSSGEKVINRYKDERRNSANSSARFNMLYSITRTLKPATYSRPPKPEVTRRFRDQDPIARTACQILERSIEYEVTQYTDFHSSMSQVVDDMLLPGRGVAWVRYEPEIETIDAEPTITEDTEIGGEGYKEPDEGNDAAETAAEENAIAGEEASPYEMVSNETTPVDYVHWRDFAHSCSRTWEEVTWVARRVYLDSDEGEARFGDKFREVPLVNKPDGDNGSDTYLEYNKKAAVWEVWCKASEKVYWVAEGYQELLDERDDPLELECFFPCPKPLFSCITTDNLISAPLFRFYQDQADELDDITGRIIHLTKAMKVMGLYAADEASIARLMKEGNDAVMIPVTNWPAFMEKGGIQGALQFVPLSDVAGALQQLYAAREQCKQTIYEITGMSDIVRGASMASESATAQQIKAQYASVRLNDLRDEVARFARDILRIKAEIMCSKYQPETLVKESGIDRTQDAQYAEQALQLLKNEPMRNFAIDIETDALVQVDEQQEKQSRVEFLAAAGGFLEKAVQAAQVAPDIVPLVMQMMLFGIRGWKVGREMEGQFEATAQQILQKQAQPKPQQPDPEMIKQQAETQRRQSENQTQIQQEQIRAQKEITTENMRQMAQTHRDREQHAVDLTIASMKNPMPAPGIVGNVNMIEGGLNG